MSQYATVSNLTSLVIPALALAGMTAAGIVPDDHLTKASGKVDSYLRGRYRLPLTAPYPDEIIANVCQIAGYTILCARGFDPTNHSDMNIRMQHDDAIRWLRDVASGLVNLADTADATSAHDGGPIVSSRNRTDIGAFRDDEDCTS